jgi:hypothetical protein
LEIIGSLGRVRYGDAGNNIYKPPKRRPMHQILTKAIRLKYIYLYSDPFKRES